KVMGPEAARHLAAALEVLRAADPFDAPTLEATLTELVERLETTPKAVYQPLRVAITGTTVSPGIFDSLGALGREEAVRRVANAFEAVGHMPALAESRRRLLGACQSGSAGEVVLAAESDVALTIAVIRAAREVGERPAPVASVRAAVDRLGSKGVAEAVAKVQTYDPFAGSTL